MTSEKLTCIRCGRNDDTRIWRGPTGEPMGTCYGENRKEHPGRRCTWTISTGEEFHPGNPEQHKFYEIFQRGIPHDMRGFSGDFLYDHCGIVCVTAKNIGDIFGAEFGLFYWAAEREANGFFISALPLRTGTRIAGIQFRAFERRSGDAEGGADNTRTIGKEGLFAPSIAGRNYDAATLHEGAWGAVAQLDDAQEYGGSNIAALAVPSASTPASLVKFTCNLLLPDIPIFILADNDQAGWAMRYRQKEVGILISLPAVGDAKDYRDLPQEFRFEELAKIVHRHLNERDRAGGTRVPLNDEELDIRLAKYIRTEFGLGTRFIARYGHQCRFVEKWGKWMVFNGSRWECSSLHASFFAQETIKALLREALYLDQP